MAFAKRARAPWDIYNIYEEAVKAEKQGFKLQDELTRVLVGLPGGCEKNMSTTAAELWSDVYVSTLGLTKQIDICKGTGGRCAQELVKLTHGQLACCNEARLHLVKPGRGPGCGKASGKRVRKRRR